MEDRMKYTREQLDEALMDIIQNAAYIKSAGRSSACTKAAELCFIKEKMETNSTRIIRAALKDLTEEGSLIFNKNNYTDPDCILT
jgi:hypothetical protein